MHFRSQKSIGKCRLENGRHFVSAWMCQKMSYFRNLSHVNGVVQGCSISIANALEILQSCIKKSIWLWFYFVLSELYHYILVLYHTLSFRSTRLSSNFFSVFFNCLSSSELGPRHGDVDKLGVRLGDKDECRSLIGEADSERRLVKEREARDGDEYAKFLSSRDVMSCNSLWWKTKTDMSKNPHFQHKLLENKHLHGHVVWATRHHKEDW